MSLRQIIAQEIDERGPIPFSRYMELCLYHPELGYYSRPAEQFGKAGDFYTSSDVHAVFGRLLARQFEEMWRLFGSPARIEILELGPGRGLFARDVLTWSEKKFSAFFHALHYSLEERSSGLQARLNKTLGSFVQTGKASMAGELAPTGQRATEVPIIIFANEFFDALPVEVVSKQGSLRISVQDERFIETWAPPSAEELEFLDRYSVHPEPGERIEVPLLAQRYMSRLTASMRSGIMVAIDYGYTRQEQLAGRHRGTLMAYRQHSASPNPYEAPGEQDLTAHVNFYRPGGSGGSERNASAAAADPVPVPHGHWGGKSVCRRLRRLPSAPGTGESCLAAQASGDSRRPGGDLPCAGREPRA